MTTCIRCGEMVAQATATMGVDGMICPSCSASARVEVDPTLTTPAGPMPTQLTILLVLMAISVLSGFLQGSYIGVLLNIALIAGVLAGNHGVRKFLLFFAWISLLISGVIFAMLVGGGETTGTAIGAYSVAVSAFTVWTLSHSDVRDWMFKTAFKDGL